MKNLGAVLVGLLVAAATIMALHWPLHRRRTEIEARLEQQQRELDRLRPVSGPVDAFLRQRGRLDRQVGRIEKERARRCPLPLGRLDPEAVKGARIEGLVLDRSSLVVLGAADSEAALQAFASTIRGLPWAREVQDGAAGPLPSAFGLFAAVELPPCPTDPPARADVDRKP